MSWQRSISPREWSNSRQVDAELFLDIACRTLERVPSIGEDYLVSSPASSYVCEVAGSHASTAEWLRAFEPSVGEAYQVSSSPRSDVREVEELQISTECRRSSSADVPCSPNSDVREVVGSQVSTEGSPSELGPRSSSADGPSLAAISFWFFVHAVGHTFVIPLVFIIVMMPLEFNGTPYEAWEVYHCLIMSAIALYFSENMARLSLGFRMSMGAAFSVFVMCAAIAVSLSLIGPRRSNFEASLYWVVILLVLFSPAISRATHFVRHGYSITPLLWFLLVMIWCVSPAAISVVLYFVLRGLEWKDDDVMVAGCVALWTSVPFLVKAIGWKLVQLGSPRSKFVAPVIWTLYCDLSFGTLGLPLFIYTTRTVLLYASSVVPVLLLYMAQGAGWFSWCSPSSGRVNTGFERKLRQLGTLLEALCVVQGHAVAFTVYLIMMVLDRVTRAAGGESHVRHSMMDGSAVDVLRSVQIYRYKASSENYVFVASSGFLVAWGSFCFFSWMLPHTWTGSSAQVAPAADLESNQQVEAATNGGGWMHGGDRVQTLCQQHQFILCFFEQHMHLIASMGFFAIAMTVAAVNSAEIAIHAKA
eukprot:TRINITY_DN17834_c0_g1_i1.p1 TRINITY_DN17834_c0_g1~~TRINITY_DN17834_c0_g1_i1.p1  ORF type:complete len:588 (+),score=35.75 TRINITY_DN17834_c0_g1_i1:60-1823(+)